MKWTLIQPEYKYNVGFPLSIAHVATFLKNETKEDVKCYDLNLQSLESVVTDLSKEDNKSDIVLDTNEVVEYKWITPKEALNLNLIPGAKECINLVLKEKLLY